jgi:PAS domain S-box-containing protein
MGSSGSSPDIAPEDITDVFSRLDEPSTPLTAAEVAAEIGCEPAAARHQLDALVDSGALHAKRVNGSDRVWWRPGGRDLSDGDDQPEATEFSAFVSAVKDYAIFMLDPDGYITSWNTGAERLKGYTEDEILGNHFSIFYTEPQREAGLPERLLDEALATGSVEHVGTRVHKDGSTFQADVVITAVYDEDDTLRGFGKVTRDISDDNG